MTPDCARDQSTLSVMVWYGMVNVDRVELLRSVQFSSCAVNEALALLWRDSEL